MALSSGTLYVNLYGVLGGVLWGTANVLVIPTVKFLGLGVGFAMYHAINMAVGYAIGRFGLLGAPREEAKWPAVRDAGLGLLLVSLVFMVFVEPEIEDVEDVAKQPVDEKRGGEDRSPASMASIEMGDVRDGTARDGLRARDVRVPSALRPSEQPSERKKEMLLPPGPLSWRPSTPRGREKPSRSLSVDQLDELSMDASARLARKGYSNWRRGGAQGAVELSSGLVGVRSKVNKARVVREIRASPVLWPLYDAGASVISHYRSMISSSQPTLAPFMEAENPTEDSRLLDTPRHVHPKASSDKRRRFVLGGVCGWFAGILCGTNMLPYVLYLDDQRKHHHTHGLAFNDTLAFLLSQCLGVFVAATVLLALCTAAASLLHIELRSPAVWPGWTAGTLWSAGFLLAAVAVDDLGMAQAYT